MQALQFSALLLVSTSLSSNAFAQVSPGSESETAPVPAPVAPATPASPADGAASPAEPAPAQPVEEGSAANAEGPVEPIGSATQTNECRPDCRVGFTCVGGQCISACNPPCAEGESCTTELTCEAKVAPVQADAPPRAEEPEVPMPEGLQERIDARMNTRFGLSFYLAAAGLSSAFISDFDLPEDRTRNFGGTGIAGAVTVRRNYHRYFGIQGRLLVGHYWLKGSLDELDSVKAGGMTSILAEFTHLFGPFGRFYVGPSFGVGALIFDRSRVSLIENSSLFSDLSDTTLFDTAVFTGGTDLGFHFGPREEIDLNLRLRLGAVAKPPEPQSDFDLFYEAALGIGYSL